jgi:acyl carrier protein
MRDALIRYIQNNLVGSGGAPITADESLIDRGIIDSIGLMRIMTFIESETGIRVPDGRITPDDFQSVEAIERMVEELRRPSAV